MMYRILYNKQEIYGPDLDRAVLNPTLELELNSAGKLEFTLPVTRSNSVDDDGHPVWPDDIWNSIQVFRGEVEVYEGDDCIFYGRPLQIVRNWNNEKVVTCEGALAYFNDTIQPTKEYKQKKTPLYNDSNYPEGGTYNKGFFNSLIERHNEQLKKDNNYDQSKYIEVGNVTVENALVWRKTDFETTASCLQSMCLDTNGGYFILRKEWKEEWQDYINKIDWVKSAPIGCDQNIQFGLNLLDISQDLNGADICTILYPTGDDDLTVKKATTHSWENPYVIHHSGEDHRPDTHIVHEANSDYIIHVEGYEKYGRVVKQKSFDVDGENNTSAEANLLYQKAREWLDDQNWEETTIECSAADLHYVYDQTPYYSKEDDPPQKLMLGQMVNVVDAVHDITRQLPIYKCSMELDSGVKKITMGTPPKKELTDIIKPSSSSSTRNTSGGNASSGGSSGGESGGGSTSIPVKDVLVKEPGYTEYGSVVKNKKAKIDLSGYVTDVQVDGTSVKDDNGVVNLDPDDFGKVDDVRVDGESIVQNKIANLSSNDFGKVDDVQVNGTSVLNNKIARLNGYVDGTEVTYNYNVHEYYWEYVTPIGGGPSYWTIRDRETRKTANAVYNSDNKTLRFDLYDKFQRNVTWGGGFVTYFDNLGSDPPTHDDVVEGNYIVRSTFPFGSFYINDAQIDLASSILDNADNTEKFSLNFINGGGIKVETSRHYYLDGEGFDIKLSTIKDANKPHLESVFSDDTMFAEGASSDVITYYIQHDGIYLISMISSEVSSLSITFEDSSGTTITPTIIVSDSGTVSGVNVAANTKLCQLEMGTVVKFNRWKTGSYLDGDTCLRTITEVKNIDLTNASAMEYKSVKVELQTTTSSSSATGNANITDTYPNGAVGIFSAIAYDADNAPSSPTNFYAMEPSATVSPTGLIKDPYAVVKSEGKIVGSLGDYNYCRARTVVAYDSGPTSSQVSSKMTLGDSARYLYTGNSKAYAYFYGVIISAGKYSEDDEGYVTETEMADAIDDAVTQLEANFQDGVDAIYDACVAKGSTPASQSLSDVVQGIMDIPQGGGGSGYYEQINPFTAGTSTLTLYDDSLGEIWVQTSSIDSNGTADASLLKWTNGMGFVIELKTDPGSRYKVEFDYENVDCDYKSGMRLGYLLENSPRTNYYQDYTSWEDNIERDDSVQSFSTTIDTTGTHIYLNFNLTGIENDGRARPIDISNLKVYKYIRNGIINFSSATSSYTIDEEMVTSTHMITNIIFMSEVTT